MFEYRDNKKFCTIHPGTELSPGVTKLKKKLKAVWSCPDCDSLVTQLKTQKCTKDRYLK